MFSCLAVQLASPVWVVIETLPKSRYFQMLFTFLDYCAFPSPNGLTTKLKLNPIISKTFSRIHVYCANPRCQRTVAIVIDFCKIPVCCKELLLSVANI